MHLQAVPRNDEAERLGLKSIIAVCDLAPGCLRNELLTELTRILRNMNRSAQLVTKTFVPIDGNEYQSAANVGNNLNDYMTK